MRQDNVSFLNVSLDSNRIIRQVTNTSHIFNLVPIKQCQNALFESGRSWLVVQKKQITENYSQNVFFLNLK